MGAKSQVERWPSPHGRGFPTKAWNSQEELNRCWCNFLSFFQLKWGCFRDFLIVFISTCPLLLNFLFFMSALIKINGCVFTYFCYYYECGKFCEAYHWVLNTNFSLLAWFLQIWTTGNWIQTFLFLPDFFRYGLQENAYNIIWQCLSLSELALKNKFTETNFIEKLDCWVMC